MTDQEREWDYRFNERLAILTQGGNPTREEIKIAEDEANEAVAELAKERK